MIIKLVSYNSWARLSVKERELRISTAATILNNEDSDFVMFSEWIFNKKEDLDTVCKLVYNKKVTALFELKLGRKALVRNHLYLLQNGEVIDLETHQIFSDSSRATEDNIRLLVDELELHRQFVVQDKTFLIIQCGENNILKTQKDEKNNAEFRLSNKDLKKRFEGCLSNADIILNPTHSKWLRFYDFTCRLSKFSEKNRFCFYCTQLEDNMLENALKHPEKNTTQRAMNSRRIMKPIYTDSNNHDYLLQAYEI